MPNNANLGSARTVIAALMHTQNNKFKMGRLGALQALLSPSFAEVRNEISPYGVQAQNGLGWKQPAGRDILVPAVTVNTYPARVVDGYDERTRDLNGEALSAPVSTEVVYDFYKEIKVNRSVARELYEPKAIEYMSQLLVGKINEIVDPRYASLMDRLGVQIMQDFNAGVALPANAYILSALIARIGKNAAAPTASSPSVGSPLVTVPTFESDKSLKVDFWDFIRETKDANKITGNLVMIGGTKAVRAMNREGILSINDAGFDWSAMFGKMPVDFYFDETIDSVFGDGQCLLIDSGAAAAETFCYADFANKFGDPTNSDDTSDSKARIAFMDLPEDNSVLANTASSFIRDVDVRSTRKRDANDFSVLTATVAMPMGIYIRPNGWFTEDNTDIMHGVSGIFACKLT